MNPLELVNLTKLMDRTQGNPEVKIGLIDGPVFSRHTDLVGASLHEIPGNSGAACVQANSAACLHGTFVAGILSAKRTSQAPSICPQCTLLIRPIFAETDTGREHMPSATPQDLSTAIIACIHAGARIINLSLALARPSAEGERVLGETLDQAMRRGVVVVAAAGNQGAVGSSAITRHPWVIPVVACDLQGRPTNDSNLSGSTGRRGLRAPGEGITSLSPESQSLALGGTSVAAPFVAGAAALLWSEFPVATATEVKLALIQSSGHRQATVTPPLLDAWAAYEALRANARWRPSQTKIMT